MGEDMKLLDGRQVAWDKLDNQPVAERAHTRNICHLSGEVDLHKNPQKWPDR